MEHELEFFNVFNPDMFASEYFHSVCVSLVSWFGDGTDAPRLKFSTTMIYVLCFDVEIWNWKRVDLSRNVIAASTNAVKGISLYSSGNNAVLMGWASLQGLPNLDKYPKVS